MPSGRRPRLYIALLTGHLPTGQGFKASVNRPFEIPLCQLPLLTLLSSSAYIPSPVPSVLSPVNIVYLHRLWSGRRDSVVVSSRLP